MNMNKKLKQEAKKKVKDQTKNEKLSKVSIVPKNRIYKFMKFSQEKKPENKLSGYEERRFDSLRAELRDFMKKNFD